MELKNNLKGKTLYIPGMDYATAKLIASAFKSIGVNAIAQVDSDVNTVLLGSQYTSGEECLPEKITIGDFMKVVLSEDFDQDNSVFFMPISNGPCRFGQYAPYFSHITKKLGYNVNILSPTGEDGYAGISENPLEFMRILWIATISADILRKLLHKIRPYEIKKGDTDKVFEEAVKRLEQVFLQPLSPSRIKKNTLKELKIIKRDFMSIRADFSKPRPLIGIVGEIFCRLNTFTNHDIIRKLEEYGAEVWLSDISEWVWYTNYEEIKNLNYAGKKYSIDKLKAKVKHFMQRKDEEDLYAVFKEEFRGYEEPKSIYKLLDLGEKYLNRYTAIGEMMLSVSKSVYLYEKGADGVIDISPFSCMNGIISEAIYPRLSEEHNNFPIKSIYFDESRQDHLDRDLPLFMKLVENYSRRKKKPRVVPYYFDSESLVINNL